MPNVSRLTQIVPALPPAAGGVADYAVHLAQFCPTEAWIVARGAVETREMFGDWVVTDAASEGWSVALERQPVGTILVHYAQYGYCGGGIPWRLVVGLRRWRRAVDGGRRTVASEARTEDGGRWAEDGVPERRSDGTAGLAASGQQLGARGSKTRRLVVFFHETWLEGPLWQRRGLAAPFARWCARALARAADVVVTNCERHAAQLSDVCEVTVLPVPANISPEGWRRTEDGGRGAVDGGRKTEDGGRRTEDGGPATVDCSPCVAPRLRLVIFGLPETRLRTLRAHRFFISWLRARGGLGELVLLGAGDETHRFAVTGMRLATELAGGAVRRVGERDEAGLSAELARADLGLSAYAADEVGKSGTLAAYFTHGCTVGCAGHDAGGLALDLSAGPQGVPRDWPAWQDEGACTKREALVAAYVAESLDWRAHAERMAEGIFNR